jgi:hypothetical protein
MAEDVSKLSPGEQEALAAYLAARRGGGATETERKAMQALAKPPSARHLQARLEKEIRAGIAKLKAGPNFEAPVPPYDGPPVRVGFDAEWVTVPDGKKRYKNEILCITAVLQCGALQSRYIYRMRGPSREDRPTMAVFFQRLLHLALEEKTIQGLPNRVLVFGHFIRGDLASFRDFWGYKKQFRGLGKTLVSGRAGHVLELTGDKLPPQRDRKEEDTSANSSRDFGQATLRDLKGQRYKVRIRFVDTIKLTPGGKNLEYVGKMVGLGKLDLHRDLGIPEAPAPERPEMVGRKLPARYGKERMDLVFRDYPAEAERYAFQDAEIALKYGLWMESQAREQFSLPRLPGTLAGIATALILRMSGGADKHAEMIGREVRTQAYFHEKHRKFITRKREISSPGLEIYEQFAKNAYHGGRNECFYHGPTPVGVWYDYDLPGAYTTALTALRPLDYEKAYSETNPDAYGIDDMGIAWITFEFPPGTRFPCLPVRGVDDALFFPLNGRRQDKVFVCAPEIFLARRLGARITVIQGFKVPWKSEHRIFDEFTRLVQSKRREFPKKDYPALNELWKEVGNSGYGLTAQGLKEKNVFDPQSMDSKPIGYSPLTEPFQAAWSTSFIRAVLGEILARLPQDGRVVTVTTDGLLTDVPIERLDLGGPLCDYFASLRERLFGAREVLDPAPKHGARQLISVAVRTTFTVLPAAGFERVCAKGSVKPPTSKPLLQNRHMIRLYLKQHPGMKIEHEQLISAREQLTRELDLYSVKRERTLNLQYDFKRKPIDPKMVRLGRRIERIAWDTAPWRTLSEAEFARVRLDGWSRGRRRLLKTMEDFRDWEAYFEASWAVESAHQLAGLNRKVIQVRDDNAAGVLKRVFLQAGRQGVWGVVFESRTLVRVAEMLTAAGYPTGKEDITYAKRRAAPLLAHCVPWVPETRELLAVILRHFPTFDYRMAFAGDDPEAKQSAAHDAASDVQEDL